MVEGHLSQGNFDSDLVKLGPKLVDASIELHRHVMNNFLPSAVKFHYQFNLRELSNITQVRQQPTYHDCNSNGVPASAMVCFLICIHCLS